MSLETKTIEIAKDFLAAKEKFEKIGFELIGTKDMKEKVYFLVRKEILKKAK